MTDKDNPSIDKPAISKEGESSEHSEVHSVSNERQLSQDPRQSRKAGLSKREIMEELSRARFPWDE